MQEFITLHPTFRVCKSLLEMCIVTWDMLHCICNLWFAETPCSFLVYVLYAPVSILLTESICAALMYLCFVVSNTYYKGQKLALVQVAMANNATAIYVQALTNIKALNLISSISGVEIQSGFCTEGGGGAH